MRRDLTTAAVADQLGLSASTVQKYAREGAIPFETTPGGHRRYNLGEVRRALYPPPPALQSLELRSPLGAGSRIDLSESARLQRDARSTVSPAGDASHLEDDHSQDALAELFGHARRVLVSTSA